MKPNVVITTSSFDVAGNPHLQTLMDADIHVVSNPHRRRLTAAEVRALVNIDTVGLLAGVEPLDAAVFARAPALRVVARCGTGVDNVDAVAAAARRIAVSATPDAPVAAVAELTLGLMLAVLRHIPLADRRLRCGEWGRWPGGLLGERTVGIVGLGRIGSRVAALCRAFGARVVAFDPAVAQAGDEVVLTTLDVLLEQSDVVSLHLPCNERTRNLLDDTALRRMKSGAVVINTARGALIDEAALVAALGEGRLAGAGLDVFAEEPYTGPLLDFDSVVVTPHQGSLAREARRQMELEAARNLLSGLQDAGVLPVVQEVENVR